MLLEIDTRKILGNGGEVVWSLWDGDNGLADPCHTVSVFRPDGSTVASVTCETGEEARDAFLHTFARPDVPDVFARAHDAAA